MIAEAPRSRRPYPSVTAGLLAANVVIWLGMTWIAGRGDQMRTVSDGPSITALIAAGATASERIFAYGEYWRLISACFLHSGFLHIAFNAWALWVFGPHLERALGKGRYLLLYVLCGIAGSYLSARMNPGVVGVGASGAIFGLLGAVWSSLKRRGAPPEAMREIVWIAGLNLAFGLRPGSHVDNWAHGGGLAAGLLLGFLIPDRARAGKAAGRALDGIGWVASAALLVYGLGFAGRNAFFQLIRPDLAPLRIETGGAGRYSIGAPDGWRRIPGNRWDLWQSSNGPLLLAHEVPPDDAARIVSSQEAISYASILAKSLVGGSGGDRLLLSGEPRVLNGFHAFRLQGAARSAFGIPERVTLYWIDSGRRCFIVAMVAPDDRSTASHLLDRVAATLKPG